MPEAQDASRLQQLLDEATKCLREGRHEIVLGRILEFDAVLRRLAAASGLPAPGMAAPGMAAPGSAEGGVTAPSATARGTAVGPRAAGLEPPGPAASEKPVLTAADLPVLKRRVDALLEECRGSCRDLSVELEALRTLNRFRQDAETRSGAWLNRDA